MGQSHIFTMKKTGRGGNQANNDNKESDNEKDNCTSDYYYYYIIEYCAVPGNVVPSNLRCSVDIDCASV